tara:strand:+ start:445 stop:591 length:147 start_codon:yes stop_codon:yes gene_type:complete
MNNKTIRIKESILKECLDELEGAADYYGEGPPDIDEDLIRTLKNILGE